MRKFSKQLAGFLFPAESDTWITVLRVGLGVDLILFCISLRADWTDLFFSESAALIRRDLTEAVLSSQSHFIPRMGWLVDLAGRIGVNEQTALNVTWALLLFAGMFLIAGFFSRASAIIACFLHLCAVKSTGSLTYGFDNFTSIGLFYLAVAPLPDRWSLDYWFWTRRERDSRLYGLHHRVLQLHLCLIYFFGGIAKCAGTGWWNGESIWRALTHPPFNLLSPAQVASWGYLLPAIGIFVCVLELGYPVFIWLRKTRAIWFGAVVAMHAGIGLAMGMWLFALIMIVLNLAAFGTELGYFRGKIARFGIPDLEAA